MIDCPYCDQPNIEGMDSCERCHQPLTETYLQDPATYVERSLLRDRVQALSPKVPIATKSSTLVADALQLMVDRDIGSLVIVDEQNRVAGIFSERDALARINMNVAELGGRTIAEFMTTDPRTLQANAKVAFAVHRMDVGGFRHIPIVSAAGECQGIISVRDILRYLSEKMSMI
jgi:CBS domain-containing protein